MKTKEIGKIRTVHVGLGGYQGAEFGIWLDIGGKGWGCGTGKGFWSMPPSKNAKWNKNDQRNKFGEIAEYINDLLKKAAVQNVEQLRGIPIEAEFDSMRLTSWRVLEEAI